MGNENNLIPLEPVSNLDDLCSNSAALIFYARSIVVQQVNLVQLMTFYSIGRWIVEVEQGGASRAAYGKQVMKTLSMHLTAQFGRGFSVDNLENMRKFYLAYRGRISETLFRKFAIEKSETVSRILADDPPFRLSFSHYLILCRIQDDGERQFYEDEAVHAQWSVKQLQRQYGSSLYQRLLLSTDKATVISHVKQGKTFDKSQDFIKDPYVLEFLGLKEDSTYSETELETRIIDHLQEFLMEMGKGFTFVGRQVRFTFDEDHFRVDLVLYNRLLRCFVLVDLKAGKLKHQDLGQMQMYVNYYDRYEKQPYENPTIGILLCADKNERMVELTLPKDANIYASQYALYLPDKKLLQAKLQEWIAEESSDSQA